MSEVNDIAIAHLIDSWKGCAYFISQIVAHVINIVGGQLASLHPFPVIKCALGAIEVIWWCNKIIQAKKCPPTLPESKTKSIIGAMSTRETGEESPESAAVCRVSRNLEHADKQCVVTEDPSSHSISFVSETKCKGCDFNKASLRQHLSKTGKNCREQYSEEELQWLAQRAKSIHKEQVAQRSQRTREYHAMHKTPEKERKTDFICKICDKQFISNHVLDRHMCEAHSSGQNRIKCTECDMTFSRWHTMADHRRDAHHGYGKNKSHKCGICDKSFTQSGTLNRHMKNTHGEEKKYECGQCPSRYARREDLERHLQKGKHIITEGSSSKSVQKEDNSKWDEDSYDEADELDKKFICSICDKTFVTKSNLSRHVQQIHNNESVPCTKCCKVFSRKDELRDHLNAIHGVGGSKSLKCSSCGKTFTNSSHYRRHVHEVHMHFFRPNNHDLPEDPPSSSNKCLKLALYQCDICKKNFLDNTLLTKHQNEVHKEVEFFQCPQCPKEFSREENMIRHLDRGKHWITLGCRYCHQDIVFKSYSAFRAHYVARYRRKKNTCVNAMKMRETDPDFDKTKCSICKEKMPEREYFSGHNISRDPEEPAISYGTCLTALKKRKFIQCTCCRERLDTSTSEWKKHFYREDLKSYDYTDCNRMFEWRGKDDLRGWQPLLIKGILVPRLTAHMPLDHPCHERYPLYPRLPLPCWTHEVIMSLLGNSPNTGWPPIHSTMEGETRLIWYASQHSSTI